MEFALFSCHMLRSSFILDLLYVPEDGGSMFLRNVGKLYRIRCYIPEDSTLHSNGFFGYVNFEKFVEYQIDSILVPQDGFLPV
jgi:hypothetical protein